MFWFCVFIGCFLLWIFSAEYFGNIGEFFIHLFKNIFNNNDEEEKEK